MTTFPREVNIADLPLSIDKQELQRERIVLHAVVQGVIGKGLFCGNEDLYETLTLTLSTSFQLWCGFVPRAAQR